MHKYLFLGAHADDIEIGCLGTILNLKKEISIQYIIFSSSQIRKKEIMKAYKKLKSKNINILKPIIYNFSDSNFENYKTQIKKKMKLFLKKNSNIKRIYTHSKKDLHQDHRIISESTLEVFRDHSILCYEIPKYDGNPFKPKVFVKLNKKTINEKTNFLMNNYNSQHNKFWYRPEVFIGLASLRGVEARSNYAEAFELIKMYEK